MKSFKRAEELVASLCYKSKSTKLSGDAKNAQKGTVSLNDVILTAN